MKTLTKKCIILFIMMALGFTLSSCGDHGAGSQPDQTAKETANSGEQWAVSAQDEPSATMQDPDIDNLRQIYDLPHILFTVDRDKPTTAIVELYGFDLPDWVVTQTSGDQHEKSDEESLWMNWRVDFSSDGENLYTLSGFHLGGSQREDFPQSDFYGIIPEYIYNAPAGQFTSYHAINVKGGIVDARADSITWEFELYGFESVNLNELAYIGYMVTENNKNIPSKHSYAIQDGEWMDLGEIFLSDYLKKLSGSTTDYDKAKLPFTQSESITYLDGIPVSFIVGGEQQLIGGDEVDIWRFKQSVYEIVADAPSYVELPRMETPCEAHFPFRSISSNGVWDFFPVNIRYENYTLDTQPDQAEWSAYFRSIGSIPEDIPVIFTDAWFFDWSNNGVDWVFVAASNVIDHNPPKENAPPNPPPPGDVGYYILSALFVEGKTPMLSDALCWAISSEPLNENTYAAYLPSIDGAGPAYVVDYSLIQFDSQGEFIECPVYNSVNQLAYQENGNGKGYVLLCDIDGDGMAELLYYLRNIYSPIRVYKLLDGEPTEVFRIGTGG